MAELEQKHDTTRPSSNSEADFNGVLSRVPTPMRHKGPHLIFGYRHVSGVPLCPCNDPGNYCSMEQLGDDPLVCQIRCWCGSKIKVTFDDLAERSAFIAAQAVSS